jgi:hypothetical protein
MTLTTSANILRGNMNPFTIFDTLYKWLALLAIVMVLAIGAGYKGYTLGVEHQKSIYATAQSKANEVVVQKNEATQEVADKEAEIQVIYKDKIVTQYKTITKEVIKYVETPAANVGLDPEFVRLHNRAASANNAAPIAEPASGANTEATPTGVTTGEAIGVITRNYEQYYQCVRQVNGWVDYYRDLQKKVNERNDKLVK